MSKLKDILSGVNVIDFYGDMDVEVNNVQFDSREITDGDAFVAIKGIASDGHEYINSCIEKGAKAIIYDNSEIDKKEGIAYILVKDSNEALGYLAANHFNNPSEKIKLIGITGTNGKTTCATLLHQLFMNLGYQVGLLSTIENKINNDIIPSTHTTPDPIQLNMLLSKMVKQGCSYCFMEVSSHAVVQHRITGLSFDGGIFTNISHDHLDYHKTFDEYIKAKKQFFDGMDKSAFALVNLDDKRGTVMVQNCKGNFQGYSLKRMADFKARVLSNSFDGLEIEIDGTQVWFGLIGEFNAYNLLAIYGTAILLGEEKEEVLSQLSVLKSANGRFEFLQNDENLIAIVDYAHTPDALENVLKTINDIRTGNEQVITVVGCGGDRDKDKRPKMAAIAAKYSNKIILTSDNPRTEEPDAIIKDMEMGLAPTELKNVVSITNRKEAIKMATMLGNGGDIILVAGKGHENYQEINGVKSHFDDKEILEELFLKN